MANALNYWQQLQSTVKGSMSIDEYLTKMKSLADQMEVAVQPIQDSELITIVLAGLDREYDSVVSLIMHQKATISWSQQMLQQTTKQETMANQEKNTFKTEAGHRNTEISVVEVGTSGVVMSLDQHRDHDTQQSPKYDHSLSEITLPNTPSSELNIPPEITQPTTPSSEPQTTSSSSHPTPPLPSPSPRFISNSPLPPDTTLTIQDNSIQPVLTSKQISHIPRHSMTTRGQDRIA
ncbi:hypothetical protein EZV62_008178 [Acer yangbiense]|uniref:Uncharacterized protein n=1 Tax=Acer yangbiense TaxID=1000413 RepID=A0A5C7IC02_9ROSI|nr:hypothetical protein EZV62_008178 [Acer yangbiense]